MVINGLYGDSDDSEDGGNTTDTLDDADDDGLARFGIETDEVHVPHDSYKEAERQSEHKTRSSSRKEGKKPAVEPTAATVPAVPPMGDFTLPDPSPFGRKTMTVLDGSHKGPILSPFSVTKVRRGKRFRVRRSSILCFFQRMLTCINRLTVWQRKRYSVKTQEKRFFHFFSVYHVCTISQP